MPTRDAAKKTASSPPRKSTGARKVASHAKAAASPAAAEPAAEPTAVQTAARIRVGIGGWTFPPWRGEFYPKGLPQRQELEYASRQVTSIEINGTFYGTQKPASFVKWRDETPEDFVFALKAPRFATHRRVLGEAGESIERFLHSGIAALGTKLGPINWQMAPTKRFEPDDFEAFLALLPPAVDNVPLRHAVELRHPSFATAACVDLLRQYGVAAIAADSADYPQIFDVTAPFVYLRLQAADEGFVNGYAPKALDQWRHRAEQWAAGQGQTDLPTVSAQIAASPDDETAVGRDVFLYFINGFKPKAPMAARALLDRLGHDPAAAR